MRPVPQYRWRVQDTDHGPALVYYGLRNPPKNREQVLPLSLEAASALARMDGKTALEDLALGPDCAREIEALIQAGVLVEAAELRAPATIEKRQTCVRCLNNDLVIPGLEFDARGVCAFCQCYEQGAERGPSFVQALGEDELLAGLKGNRSRFEVMVLFTGGKDSSFMLWHMARRLGLRVLAAFWDMPYTQDSARENIERCMSRLPEVEFISWRLPWTRVKQAMRGQLEEFGWPCLCPTAAFALFYPLALEQNIPFVLFGMEDVQASVMDYVFPPGPGPAKAPSPRERTLAFLKFRAMARPLVRPLRWAQELANYHASIRRQLPEIFRPLQDIVARAEADPNLAVPIITRLAGKERSGSWKDIVELLERELGWRMPPGQEGMLHTSCRIECVKDYVQYMRFRNMRTVFFPQSLVELSASVFFGLTSRDQAEVQARELGYIKPPAALFDLMRDLDIDASKVEACDNEMRFTLAEAAQGPGPGKDRDE
ncbi:MAG: hypothetical protein JW718_00585 [Desulfovibrionaceae bacterium]|nr:hypothetical protein [Desulfovibrionaceae bacterium]